jgi:hypothetical protein
MGTSQGSALIPQGLAPMEASPSEAVHWVPASFMGGEEIGSQSERVHTDNYWLGPGNTPIRVICDYERTVNTHCVISSNFFTTCKARVVENRSGNNLICGQRQQEEEQTYSFYRPYAFISSFWNKGTEKIQSIWYYNGNIVRNDIEQSEGMIQGDVWGKWKIPSPPQAGAAA